MIPPSGFYTLEGRAPSGSGSAVFLTKIRHLEFLWKYGPTWKFNNIHILTDVLKEPIAIFEGLSRGEYTDGLCYSGIPSNRKSSAGQIGWDRRYVAVVFAIPRGPHFQVIDWDIRLADGADLGHPEGWGTDFERRLWQGHSRIS